jgi:hypothetical protein
MVNLVICGRVAAGSLAVVLMRHITPALAALG